MTKKERILERLAKMLVKLGSMTTDKGILVWDGDADLAVGDAVQVQNEDETLVAAEDGDYTADDGTIYRVADGKVVEIIDPKNEQPEPEEEAEESEEGEGDGEAEVEGEGEEPMPEAEPVPEPEEEDIVMKKLAEMEERIAALEALVKGQDAVIEEMKKTPLANPAHEEVKQSQKVQDTGIKGLDNLARYFKP